MDRERWEYMYLHVAIDGPAHTMLLCGVNGAAPDYRFHGKNVIEVLCTLGNQGWELVCAAGAENDMLILKRPKLGTGASGTLHDW